MQFDATTLRHLLGLFEPAPPPPQETARLASLVGSWPEFLAHLLLRRDVLRTYPEIAAAIRQRAEAYRGGPATPRPPGVDAQRLAQTEAALEAALAAMLQAEKERAELAGKVSAAWRAHVAERAPAGFDLHLRIAPARH